MTSSRRSILSAVFDSFSMPLIIAEGAVKTTGGVLVASYLASARRKFHWHMLLKYKEDISH